MTGGSSAGLLCIEYNRSLAKISSIGFLRIINSLRAGRFLLFICRLDFFGGWKIFSCRKSSKSLPLEHFDGFSIFYDLTIYMSVIFGRFTTGPDLHVKFFETRISTLLCGKQSIWRSSIAEIFSRGLLK